MNRFVRMGLVVLPLALAIGCGVGTEGEQEEQAAGAPEAQDGTAAVEIDSSELRALAGVAIAGGYAGAPAIPAERLRPERFEAQAVGAGLLQVGEPLAQVGEMGGRRLLEADGWRVELDAAGSLLASRRLPTGEPAADLDESILKTDALARLRAWGVPPAEVGRVLQRRVMAQSQEDGVLQAPALHAHKTFVFRAIQGIEVQGHRAVLSHAPDGTFERALVRWPALAEAGHALRTPLSVEAIEDRTRSALAREGLQGSKVNLRWKYLPEPGPTGEVTLKLVVGARGQILDEDGTSEPREVDVDVDAVP